MTNFVWNILEISSENDVIFHAKYKVTANNDDHSVETEGNWWFNNPTLKVPFNEVTEEMVCSWIEQETMKDGINLIKSRLEEQLENLTISKNVVAPWLPQVFIPEG